MAVDMNAGIHPKMGEMIAKAFEIGGDLADKIFDALYESNVLLPVTDAFVAQHGRIAEICPCRAR